MNTRKYDVEGQKKDFNFEAFITAFKAFHRRRKIKVSEAEAYLADQLHISQDAVHSWRNKRNAPADLETVKALAKALKMSDYTTILCDTEGAHNMNHLTERQKDAVKRIYDACISYLHEFYYSDGFNEYWLNYKDAGYNNPEEKISESVEAKLRKIDLVMSQEYFDLHGCQIYEDLYEYVNEDLIDIYNGKISYAYRFEAMVDGNPTTDDDYTKALNRLNEIIKAFI